MDQESGLHSIVEKAAALTPRQSAMLLATKQRVSNTRRMIVQSRELVKRAQQTLEYSRSLRVLVQRASEARR